jgi:hypothetical protein
MFQIPTVPPFINQTMKLVLSSPVHGMVSKTILLINFTGRKSGKTYTTPVSYSQTNDQVFIFTHAAWWKNLLCTTPVTLLLRGREPVDWRNRSPKISKPSQLGCQCICKRCRLTPGFTACPLTTTISQKKKKCKKLRKLP